jgi:hypothetical protein
MGIRVVEEKQKETKSIQEPKLVRGESGNIYLVAKGRVTCIKSEFPPSIGVTDSLSLYLPGSLEDLTEPITLENY